MPAKYSHTTLRGAVLLLCLFGAAGFSTPGIRAPRPASHHLPLPELRPAVGVSASQQRTSHSDPFYFVVGGGAALPSPAKLASNILASQRALQDFRLSGRRHDGAVFDSSLFRMLMSEAEVEDSTPSPSPPRARHDSLFHAIGKSCAPRRGPF
uniref:Uncharacterized protein n=1 Tax=Hemiselmis andersenii TaxID=464988 RepID=A0A6U4KJ46_HEMAN|mmetsp:Transcript_17614/g.40677  ORF Transcript_17614/g.40677 Transcript_17614/m.40677 type:complete len:153 (-) Transcript_17614:280-738(-)|eukprot:CAMPEP_0114139720 /NCGR_PEP_ID=MMETSP0043_2-20121206/17005_1 /TAXON_ID=464988 /ORGANISM="Hemiselmis andersenii, Strain CCMP644" /LENGTH=152 /DNA_ID=CAMNT_0001233773 /DNA_START=383 /DNA_END=841 /DNA_ORIENTATION=+